MTTSNDGAKRPEDLAPLFVERANTGDLDGLAALYATDAVLAFPPGRMTVGRQAIRAGYERLLASRPKIELGEQLPTLVYGDFALTATRTADGGARAEIAQRQADGTWLWIVDRPTFAG